MGDIFHLGFPDLSPLPRLLAPPERAQLKGVPVPSRARWIGTLCSRTVSWQRVLLSSSVILLTMDILLSIEKIVQK